jgi:putative hydrolase of the HAD superfamily
VTGALLFDLDDTLISDEHAAAAAFRATAEHGARSRELDAAALAAAARVQARELWRATPVHDYCQAIQISSWEALWCRFEGEDPRIAWLRAWSPEYRRETWQRALARQGIGDAALALELGERYGIERRRLHETFADALPALDDLAADHALGLLTNGASCLQREKLAASGLAGRFAAVVVSGEVGVGKPDPAIFAHALEALGAQAADAVMVGNSLAHDVAGARAAGMRAVWVNRFGHERPADDALVEVHDLLALRGALAMPPPGVEPGFAA